MTFEGLFKNCTDEEKEKLAWMLGQIRARNTFNALRPKREKYCFTYCGSACNCGLATGEIWEDNL